MTTSQVTDVDAAPTLIEWNTINWLACHEEVKKLQRRIAKATRKGYRLTRLGWLSID